MLVEVRERRVGDITLVEVSGRMTLLEATDIFNRKLENLISAGQIRLIVDCSQIASIDSQGISALVRGVISSRRRGGNLKLLKMSARVRQVMEAARLLTVIEAFEDEAAALASF